MTKENTTWLNYLAHAERIKELGTVGNGTDKSLHLHPMLALTVDTGTCLGL